MQEGDLFYPTKEDFEEDESKEYAERVGIFGRLNVLKAEKDPQKRQEIQEKILKNYSLDLILETIEKDIESSLKKVEGDEEKTKEAKLIS